MLRSLVFAIFTCFTTLASTGFAENAKVHLILAIDSSSNDRVGDTVAADGVNVEKCFKANIPAERLSIFRLTDGNLTENKIVEGIRNIKANPEDCIVFFYSGHGAYTEHGDSNYGHYFQLQNRTSVMRSTVIKELKEKQIRLTVLATDCCNVRVNIEPKKPGVLMKPEEEEKAVALSPLFKKLFFDACGTADITAAKEGQCSFIYPRKAMYAGDVCKGSIFTWNFCQILNKEKNTVLTWHHVFNTTAKDSNEDFVRNNPNGYDIGRGVIQKVMNPYAWELPKDNAVPPQNRPRLGIRAENSPFGNGVRITEIIAGSPGEKANFRIDDTITQINGQQIRNEDDYKNAVTNSPRKMTFMIESVNGIEMKGDVVLEY